VTVMFTDFVNFTHISEQMIPEILVFELDTYFKKFDEIISRYDIEKIKTIGDAYLCVAGLHADTDHAQKCCMAGIEIRNYMNEVNAAKGEGEFKFELRIGIHSGNLVAGVVGSKKFAYDIWGDTVNIAARMEQAGQKGQINISQATYELVKNNFNVTPRGSLPAKNKGEIEMYFIES
jgi:adenylate cyclase